MRFLHTAVTMSMSTDKMRALAEKLQEQCYPYAIDNKRNRLIAFNLSIEKVKEIVSIYQPHYLTIERYVQPHVPYEDLFNYVAKSLGRNAMDYSDYIKGRYYGTGVAIPMRHEVIYLGYESPNYPNALDVRKFVSSGLYSIDANSPTECVDEIVGATTIKSDDIVRNYVILTFRRNLPELQLGKSIMGAEAWAFDSEGKQIIAFNLPALMLDVIYRSINPTTLHYCELSYPQQDSSLYRYIRSEIQRIRETHNVAADQRIPFISNLMGLDEALFD